MNANIVVGFLTTKQRFIQHSPWSAFTPATCIFPNIDFILFNDATVGIVYSILLILLIWLYLINFESSAIDQHIKMNKLLLLLVNSLLVKSFSCHFCLRNA
jgi:hypothetical protein